MLTEISDALEARLRAQVTGLKTIGVWVGDVEDLVKQPQRLPSAHVIYAGGQFGDPAALGAEAVEVSQSWTVILLGQSLKSRRDGAEGIYPLIEAIRTALTRFDTGHGYLMPASESLIHADKGLLGYGIDFVTDTETEEA